MSLLYNVPVLTVDYETYYAPPEFSLSSMQTDAYCLDPRFEIILVSVTAPNGRQMWFSGTKMETQAWLLQFPWAECAFLAHNTLFDGFIHRQVLGLPSPKLWLDTLGMSRALFPYLPSHALKAVAAYIGVGEKGTEVEDFKGYRRANFTPEQLGRYAGYCQNDGAITKAAFDVMVSGGVTVDDAKQVLGDKRSPQRPPFPDQELALIDQRIRMFVDPLLQLNEVKLQKYYDDTIERKRKLLEHPLLILGDVPVDKATLMSNDKFAAALEAMGVSPPMKKSKATGKMTYAFAKTDEGMTDLEEHESPEVQALVAARLGNKSTIAETRALKFVETAQRRRGWPVYMNYWGAKTTGRDSGGNKINCFTPDVEVLTPSGWKRFDEWADEPIMQWEPNRSMTFVNSPKIIREHQGPIVRIDSCFVSGGFTEDHRLVQFTAAGLVKDHTAGWVASHSGLDGIPTGGFWVGASESVFTPDEARLMVAIAADGTVRPNGEIWFGFRRERKIERIQELFLKTATEFKRFEYPPQAGHKGDHNTVRFTIKGGRFSKGFGPWLLRLSKYALQAVVDEFRYWDGATHPNGQPGFSSSEKDQIEWLTTALHLCGRAAVVKKAKNKEQYQFYQRKSPTTSINTATDVWTRHDYVGQVYCCSVPSTYVLVRHNGKIFVSGQCLNLPNRGADRVIRESIEAPPGYVLVVGDSSNIELRVNFTLAGQTDLLQKVVAYDQMGKAATSDLYCDFASQIFGRPVGKDDEKDRFVGKTGELGLGYGCGAFTFGNMLRVQGGLKLDEAELQRIIDLYRDTHQAVKNSWHRMDKKILPAILNGQEGVPVDVNGWLVTDDRQGYSIPGLLGVQYHSLKKDDEGSWVYQQGRLWPYIYGGKAWENVCQHVARQIVMWQGARVGLKYPVVLEVYDEIVAVAREDEAEKCRDWMQECLMLAPKWCRGAIPLNGKVGIGKTYGDAK